MAKKAAPKAPKKSSPKTPAKGTRTKSAAQKAPTAKKSPTAKKPLSAGQSAKQATAKKATAKKATAKKATAKKATGSAMSPERAKTPGARATAGEAGFELDVRIADVEPEIWRRLVVPQEAELRDLHLALQLAFDWESAHMHMFSVGVKSFAPNGFDDVEDYDGVRLVDIAKVGTKMVYEYDFGDGWEHLIKVLNVTTLPADESRFRCLDGARRGPLEDTGGAPGYMMLLDNLRDPSSEEHEAAVEATGDDFDSEAFDLVQINKALAELDRLLALGPELPPGASGARTPADVAAADDDERSSEAEEGDLVLLFEAGEGNESEVIELPDVVVKASAEMLEKLSAFFGVAARAVRAHGRATPDMHLSQFLRDGNLERPDIIIAQDDD